MKAMVIYESMTGNTKKAAGLIADALRARGVTVTAVNPTTAINHQALSDADLVIIGSWTDGIFVFGQRPGKAGRLRQLPAMKSKQAAVFCTYALDPGKVLEKMTRIVTDLGAAVVGGMTIRRTDLTGGATEFVDRLITAMPTLADASR